MDATGIPGAELRPAYVDAAGEAELLSRIDSAQWRGDLRRRVQHYGWLYDYMRRSVDPDMRLGPLPGWAAELAARLHDDGLFDRPPDQVIVNEYLPGQGIAMHVDCQPCFGPVIASLSLGSDVTMRLDAPDAGETVDLRLPARSLLVLSGPARHDWRHGIAARKSDVVESARVPRGRRVSLTFRVVRPG